MTDSDVTLNIGKVSISYSFLYPETASFFGEYAENERIYENQFNICISREYIYENRWLVDENAQPSPFLEFQCLMLKTGNEILTHNHALFHGAALMWKGKAWVFTAPSGTGKTTQLRHWRRILKRDVRIINGDKPLLECKEDGNVIVHSSPWRGKEKFGIKGLNAPLGGIILLEQGKENCIERMEPKDAVRPLFIEFISFPENEAQIRSQAEILDQILDHVPVWKLVNLGDPVSAELTLETIRRYREDQV